MMTAQINAIGVPHREYEVKLFGGGNMFPDHSNPVSNVGVKNVDMARKLVKKHGFNCVAEHLGGDGHRNVIFNVWSGHVWVKHAVIARQEITILQAGKNIQIQDRRVACPASA
jgi:chemotaxis protein CheD